MYGPPYPAAAAANQSCANYFSYSTDASSLYSTLNPQYDIKDGAGGLHSGITQTAAYYPYEHSLGQYQYDRYGTIDFNGSAKRKNATRETTSTLKTWLYEHRKNPYPTKGEKIMLAIITKMTLTQVSTWFANARRRLKKENKMTWTPKNKVGDERKDRNEKSDKDSVNKETKYRDEQKDLQPSDFEEANNEDCDAVDCDAADCDGGKVSPGLRQATTLLERDCVVSEVLERDRVAAELLERDRVAAELLERDRVTAELQERDRVAAEILERDRVAAELQERDRVAAELLESDRVAAELLERDRVAALSVPGGFHAFACGDESTSTPSPEFSAVSKSFPPAPTGSLSHFHGQEKPRIWSLAHAAATGIALGPHPGSHFSTGNIGLDCQLPTVKLAMTGGGQCREPGSPERTSTSGVESSFQAGLQPQNKVYGAASGFSYKPLRLHCSSYPALSDACRYSSAEGFSNGRKGEAESSVLSDTCLALQEDKLTAFRPGMKR